VERCGEDLDEEMDYVFYEIPLLLGVVSFGFGLQKLCLEVFIDRYLAAIGSFIIMTTYHTGRKHL